MKFDCHRARTIRLVRAVFDVRPVEWAETLAVLQSVSLAAVRSEARAHVVDTHGTRVTLDFPALDGESTVEQLLAGCVAGEWADRNDVESCRLVSVGWPDSLPGPAFGARPGVSVGAIVKPALGLSASEAGAVAARLVAAGATLVKDDELQRSSPERARAIAAAGVDYAANVTGPDYLALAEAVLEAGATTLMVNAFLQGLGSIAELRRFDVPIFVHRVGSAFLRRGDRVSVSARVLAELTRLLGADYVQVGSFSPRMFDTDEEVREQIAACHDELNGAQRATAVIGGGVGPDNADEMLDAAGVRDGVMVLYGSSLY
jgi:ribulose 1,5-bisphosphate carboxylase large subunit-like protein